MCCIEQVKEHYGDGTPKRTHTCTSSVSDCSGVSDFFLTVTIENTELPGDLPLIADCKYGDTVKLERRGGDVFTVAEMAITGKQGGIRCSELRYTVIRWDKM